MAYRDDAAALKRSALIVRRDGLVKQVERLEARCEELEDEARARESQRGKRAFEALAGRLLGFAIGVGIAFAFIVWRMRS